jgi:hypothetical protein
MAALAQAPKAAPAPQAVAPPAAAPMVAAPPAVAPTPKPAAHVKKQAWTHADARVCLEFPTDLQVIRCAAKYRYTRVPV